MFVARRLPVLLGLALLSLTALFPAAARQGDDDPLKSLLDKPAPPLEADYTLHGKVKTVAGLKGKVVLLNFWAMWSANSVNCLPSWKAWHNEHNFHGLEVVGATIYGGEFDKQLKLNRVTGEVTTVAGALPKAAEQDLLKEFADFHKVNFRLLMVAGEDAKQAIKDYHIKSVPTMVLIDRKGVVRAVRVGAGQEELRAMEKAIERVLKEK